MLAKRLTLHFNFKVQAKQELQLKAKNYIPPQVRLLFPIYCTKYLAFFSNKLFGLLFC